MKVMILLLLALFSYNSVSSQTSDLYQDVAALDLIPSSNRNFTPAIAVDLSRSMVHSEEHSDHKNTSVQNLQESQIACDFIIHPRLHSNRFLLISYVGSDQSYCFITDETNDVVYRHPLSLSNSYTWINLANLPTGSYHVNVRVNGITYQQVLEKN